MSHSVNRADYLERLRSVRRQLVGRCASIEIAHRAEQLLWRLERCLMRPVRIALLGEVNGGKTTLANHIIGCELLTTDVVHNTLVPVLLKYASTAYVELCVADGQRQRIDHSAIGKIRLAATDRLEVGVPLDILKEIEIVDTPGAILDERALDLLRAVYSQADLAIWCTVATQAWRGTDVTLWNALDRHRRRPDILAITHADLLCQEDCEKVRERVNAEAGERFGAVIAVATNQRSGSKPSELSLALSTAIASVHADRSRRASRIITKFARKLEHNSMLEAMNGPAFKQPLRAKKKPRPMGPRA